MPRKHLIITGTGRCGTTFLVKLLTHLGLDTGFDPGDMKTKKMKLPTRVWNMMSARGIGPMS